MLKKIDTELKKLENSKSKAVQMKNKYEDIIEECDTKIKKLTSLKKKYESLENEFDSVFDEQEKN